MSHLIVHGGTPLRGRITPSANKNAVLPVLCATLLTRAPLRLHGVPDITDVRKILDIFRTRGSTVRWDCASGTLDRNMNIPCSMPRSIVCPRRCARPSCWCHRCWRALARLEDTVKGCTLGVREIDPHVDVFRRFGGSVQRADGALLVRIHWALKPTDRWLDYASVTTTENFVLCAAGAQGTSTLTNAASEPHVQEFCRFMVMLGVRIEGIGTSRVTVRGGNALGGGEFRFDEDLHEITTFLALGAITGGDVVVKNSAPENFPLIDHTFAKFGVRIVTFGGQTLTPAVVESPYIIRVAIALFMVAASIPGRSEIHHATPIRRAHPHFVENLRSLGVQVELAVEE